MAVSAAKYEIINNDLIWQIFDRIPCITVDFSYSSSSSLFCHAMSAFCLIFETRSLGQTKPLWFWSFILYSKASISLLFDCFMSSFPVPVHKDYDREGAISIPWGQQWCFEPIWLPINKYFQNDSHLSIFILEMHI